MGGIVRDLEIDMTTTIEKEKVLARLRANREEHQKIYKEAVAGFKDTAVTKLKVLLKKCSGTESIYLSIDAPKDHTDAYDTVIEMLEMTTKDEVTLGATEFAMFMQDRWSWMERFLSSSADYSATARAKRGRQ
jgi:hypothetical protein